MDNFSFVFVRSGSTRLKEKCYLNIRNNQSTFEFLIERVLKKKINTFPIVLTTQLKNDDRIFEICNLNNIEVFRGSIDINDRIVGALSHYGKPNFFSRITADNLFIDAVHVNQAINIFASKDFDYYKHDTVINGCDFEILRTDFYLEALHNSASLKKDPDAFSNHIQEFSPKIMEGFNFLEKDESAYQKYTLTLDTEIDLENCRKVCAFFCDEHFTYKQLFEALENKDLKLK